MTGLGAAVPEAVLAQPAPQPEPAPTEPPPDLTVRTPTVGEAIIIGPEPAPPPPPEQPVVEPQPVLPPTPVTEIKPREGAASEQPPTNPSTAPTSPPQPEAVPSPTPGPPSPTPGPAKTGAKSDKESEATSIVDVPPETWKAGKPLAAKGLNIKTKNPVFPTLTQLTTSPRNPIAEIEFDKSGKAVKCRLLESSGYQLEIDEPVVDALFRWRASGKQLEKLTAGQTVRMRVRVILK
ncbi:MAG: hypothetical protein EXS00_05145 [Phycisphaerales bacterium]|nr:hypothetical protein [Phycisphaerales bacterium]